MDPNRTHRVYQCVQVCMCKTEPDSLRGRGIAGELTSEATRSRLPY